MGVSIATVTCYFFGALIMIIGILFAICAVTFIGVSICALFYPPVTKMCETWLNWVKGRFGL